MSALAYVEIQVRCSVEHGNHAKKIDSLTLRWSEEGVLALDYLAQEATQGGKSVRLTARANLALNALRTLLIDHGETAPAHLQLPRQIKVLRYDLLRAKLTKVLFEPDEAPNVDKIRQAVKRVREELLHKKVVGFDEPYIWIAREPSA